MQGSPQYSDGLESMALRAVDLALIETRKVWARLWAELQASELKGSQSLQFQTPPEDRTTQLYMITFYCTSTVLLIHLTNA